MCVHVLMAAEGAGEFITYKDFLEKYSTPVDDLAKIAQACERTNGRWEGGAGEGRAHAHTRANTHTHHIHAHIHIHIRIRIHIHIHLTVACCFALLAACLLHTGSSHKNV